MTDPLAELVEHAQRLTEGACLAEAQSDGWMPPDCVVEMEAAVAEMLTLMRVRGISLCNIAENARRSA